MSYTPFVVDRFGGLDLGAPEEVTGAADLLNVEIDPDRRRVRTRDGSVAFGLSNISGALCYLLRPATLGGIERLLAISVTGSAPGTVYLDRYTTGGVLSAVGNWTANNPEWPSMVHLGTPTATYVFIAAGDGLVRRYDGTTLSTSVGKPRFLAVTPTSNRLVQAAFAAAADSPTGANGSEHTVFFSDAGAPETFSANNYVHLRPGDGESIRGMVRWRDQLFVFKRTSAFVLYGESVDAAGNPIFNFRELPLPAPLLIFSTQRPPAVAVGPDGVYFLATDGIYRTDGASTERISRPLDNWFNGSTTTVLGTSSPTGWLSVAGDRVIFTHTDGSTFYKHLVYDGSHGQWTQWDFGSSHFRAPFTDWTALVPSGASPYSDRVLFYVAGTQVYRLDTTATSDAGNAITARYQSGSYDLGAPQRKVIRETLLWGSGSPTLAVHTDYGSTDASAAAVTLGTAPAVAEGRQRIARRGVLFSFKLSSASTSGWAVNRLTHHIREARLPGAKPT